jgi:hypothetical protein
MKKILSLVILIIFSFSCQRDEQIVNPNSNNTTKSLFTAQPNLGRPVICEFWQVGSFVINGKEMASEFSAYTLNFCSDNLAYAIRESMVIHGKWSLIPDKTGYSQFLLVFDMLGDAAGPLIDPNIELLGEDWAVLEINDFILRLSSTKGKYYKELVLKKVL